MAAKPAPASPVMAEAADEANAFAWRGSPLQPGIGLALSGGGFRAMLFHAGALLRLNELGLLSKISRVASVSGGSIAAGVLAAHWPQFGQADQQGVLPSFAEVYLPVTLAFARQKLDILDVALGLLPFTSAADQVADSYDDLLFHGATLQDLPTSPEFVFCATNMSTGVLWRFTKSYAGDYIVGFLSDPDLKLATAVAASAAFPPFLSPLKLDAQPSAFRDWPAAAGARAVDPIPFRERVLLCDGGVYDNHGVEPIVKRFVTNLVSDGGAPFSRVPHLQTDWLSQLRRVIEVEDNQVRALRRRDLIARFELGKTTAMAGEIPTVDLKAGARFGAYWGIDTNPAGMAVPHALDVRIDEVERLARLPTRLSDPGPGNPEGLVNWGYAIADRCIRTHYCGPIVLADTAPRWPFP